jgi:hypothetical protein
MISSLGMKVSHFSYLQTQLCPMQLSLPSIANRSSRKLPEWCLHHPIEAQIAQES